MALGVPFLLFLPTNAFDVRVARSARRKTKHTLDLFPSSVREPKIEGLDLYTSI